MFTALRPNRKSGTASRPPADPPSRASRSEIRRLTRYLRPYRSPMVIAHRLSTIQHADRIAVLEQGRLVELGGHQALIEKGGLYARLYQLQFQGRNLEPVT